MKKVIVFAVLLLFALPAFANVGLVGTSINISFDAMTLSLQKVCVKLFFSLALLQFFITGYGHITSGELEGSLGKFIKLVAWISFCYYLMQDNFAATYVGNTIRYFLDNAGAWANPTNVNVPFSAAGIMNIAHSSIANLDTVMISANSNAIGNAAVPATSWWEYFTKPLALTTNIIFALVNLVIQGVMILVILLICGYVALKVFMITVECWIILAVMPLSLSFLGLNALKDQGFAPFKSMLALIFRIVILAMFLGALQSVSDGLLKIDTTTTSIGLYPQLIDSMFGYALVAFLVHKSDSIATSLANGSANLGSGDVAGAVMAGVAAGAAVATGGAAAVAAGSKAAGGAQGMASKIAEIAGSGSINPSGGGGKASPAPVKPAAAPSVTDSKGRPVKEAAASGGDGTGGADNNKVANEASPAGGAMPADSGGASSGAAGGAEQAPAGSGSTAAIAGAKPTLEDGIGQLAKAVESLTAQHEKTANAPAKKPSLGDRLNSVAQHASQEKSATEVSINTNTDS